MIALNILGLCIMSGLKYNKHFKKKVSSSSSFVQFSIYATKTRFDKIAQVNWIFAIVFPEKAESELQIIVWCLSRIYGGKESWIVRELLEVVKGLIHPLIVLQKVKYHKVSSAMKYWHGYCIIVSKAFPIKFPFTRQNVDRKGLGWKPFMAMVFIKAKLTKIPTEKFTKTCPLMTNHLIQYWNLSEKLKCSGTSHLFWRP